MYAQCEDNGEIVDNAEWNSGEDEDEEQNLAKPKAVKRSRVKKEQPMSSKAPPRRLARKSSDDGNSVSSEKDDDDPLPLDAAVLEPMMDEALIAVMGSGSASATPTHALPIGPTSPQPRSVLADVVSNVVPKAPFIEEVHDPNIEDFG